MGLFGQLKSTPKQEQTTHIPQMGFSRHEGTVVQRFADVSLPRCPLCGEAPEWQLHIANITTSMYPIQEVDRYHYLRCQRCGAVLHTKYHAIGSSLPSFVMSPDPQDGVTRMVVDDPGSCPRRPVAKDSVYTISELNQL